MTKLDSRAHALGQFEFHLQGIDPVVIKSAEGGLKKANTVEESVGAALGAMKHISTIEVEPLTLEVGMHAALPMIGWIRDAWNKKSVRKDGYLVHADFDFNEFMSHELEGCQISEVTLPALDGAGKDAAVIKVKIQPHNATLKVQSGPKIQGRGHGFSSLKAWTNSHFRFTLENGCDVSQVAKIDSFTVKQGLKPIYFGGGSTNSQQPYHLAEYHPTKITFPDISVHVALHYAGDLIKWYEKAMTGGKENKLETTGSIEYLAPNGKDTLFTVHLDQVGVKSMTIDKSERNDQVRRAKFELYVGAMDLKKG